MSMTYLGERVLLARKEIGLTAGELGERVGVSQGHVSKVERGQRRPTEALLKTLAIELGVNEEWLRTGIGERYSERPRVLDDELAERFVEDILRTVEGRLTDAQQQGLRDKALKQFQKMRGELSTKAQKDAAQDPPPTIAAGKNVLTGTFSAGRDFIAGDQTIITEKYTPPRIQNIPPDGSVAEAQAHHLLEAIKRIGELESLRLGSNGYGIAMAGFKRRYQLTSYKNLKSVDYPEAIAYLTKRTKVLESELQRSGRRPVSRDQFIKSIQTICRRELKWTDPIRREKLMDRYNKNSLTDLTLGELEAFYRYVVGEKSKVQAKPKGPRRVV